MYDLFNNVLLLRFFILGIQVNPGSDTSLASHGNPELESHQNKRNFKSRISDMFKKSGSTSRGNRFVIFPLVLAENWLWTNTEHCFTFYILKTPKEKSWDKWIYEMASGSVTSIFWNYGVNYKLPGIFSDFFNPKWPKNSVMELLKMRPGPNNFFDKLWWCSQVGQTAFVDCLNSAGGIALLRQFDCWL